MKFDLASLVRQRRIPRQRAVVFRDIVPPAIFASNLFQRVYAPMIALWRRYAEQITAEYERSLSALTTDAPADINTTLSAADNELQRLLLLLTPALRDWLIRLEAWQRGKFVAAVLSASSVDLTTLLSSGDVSETLDQVLAWNVNLISDVSAQAKQRISNAVFAGLTARTPAREVAKEIAAATGFARDRSLRIASHQLSSLTSQLAAQRRRQAGIDVWEWRHSSKRHPRQEHLARNGDLYSDNPDMVGVEIDGKTVKASPPSDDLPGIKPGCGCRERSVLVFS